MNKEDLKLLTPSELDDLSDEISKMAYEKRIDRGKDLYELYGDIIKPIYFEYIASRRDEYSWIYDYRNKEIEVQMSFSKPTEESLEYSENIRDKVEEYKKTVKATLSGLSPDDIDALYSYCTAKSIKESMGNIDWFSDSSDEDSD